MHTGRQKTVASADQAAQTPHPPSKAGRQISSAPKCLSSSSDSDGTSTSSSSSDSSDSESGGTSSGSSSSGSSNSSTSWTFHNWFYPFLLRIRVFNFKPLMWKVCYTFHLKSYPLNPKFVVWINDKHCINCIMVVPDAKLKLFTPILRPPNLCHLNLK